MQRKDLNSLYARLRSKIEHEDSLVNQRLTWMITLHGLLFTAYGFSLSAEASSLTAPGILSPEGDRQQLAYANFHRTITNLRHAMVIVGIVSAVAALIGVVAAFRAIREDAARLDPFLKDLPDSTYSEIIGRPVVNILGMLSGIVIPSLAGGVWAWLGGFILDPWPLAIGILLTSFIALMAWPLIPMRRKGRERSKPHKPKPLGGGDPHNGSKIGENVTASSAQNEGLRVETDGR